MNIPKHDEIMPYVLAWVTNNGMAYWRDLESPLAEQFGLSAEEVAEEYDSGNGTVFLDRIGWATSYLAMSGLVERPKRGFYQATDLRKQYVDKPEKLKQYVKAKIAEREAEKRASRQEVEEATVSLDSTITPHEALNQAAQQIRASAYDTILDTILSKNPSEFEKLVLKLLDRMGYGGQVKDAMHVTKTSHDGGIDGVIKEDVLGLGRIHIQAKRYARENSVGRDEVQRFVGALAVAQSNKGVFITTSSYSRGALEYANSLNGTTNLVLIDGEKLAEYIYDYGLGMQTVETIVIKKMDSDFWDEMADQV